jgi:DNA-binding IclR family transcriptional regulator
MNLLFMCQFIPGFIGFQESNACLFPHKRTCSFSAVEGCMISAYHQTRSWMWKMAQDKSVLVLGKAMAILDQLSLQGELTPTRISALIGEPRSTIYRLLNSLQQADMVEPGSARGSYRLGFKLFRLGSTVINRFDVRQLALPVMESLHQETGETVYLFVRRGCESVCIERLEGRYVQILTARVGDSLPLYVGGSPRVLLAYEPDEVWQEYLAHEELQALTPRTPTKQAEVLTLLQEIRIKGYSISDEDVTPGIATIGAPIFDYTGSIRAAISLGGIRSVVLGEAREEMIRKVVACARQISRQLGFNDQIAIAHAPQPGVLAQ